MLTKIHSSDTYSIDDIQQWFHEDLNAPAWHLMSDMELLENFKNKGNIEIEYVTTSDPEVSDESQDSFAGSYLPENTFKDNVDTLRQMYKHFGIFKKWYANNSNCTIEQMYHLNNIENVLESAICNELCDNV
ncbi:hypothetical protein ABEB36_014457 [Hypothenemus hampei]|uniref:Uncharacterized protein n=1 Tax=Hypothenemus hampei TaxID=57062 RepID=A0ABD1E3X5_HYPHA